MRRALRTALLLAAATSCSPEGASTPEFAQVSAELSGGAVYSRFHKFEAMEPAGGELFGTSAAMLPNVLAVGAPGEGAVYLYRRQGSKRLFYAAQRIQADSADQGFGAAVALAADGTLFVGEPQSDSGETRSGRVHIYQSESNRWVKSGELRMMTPLYDAQFGSTLVADGDRVAIGAPNHRQGVDGGSVHTYRYSLAGTWEHEGTLAAADRQFGRSLSLDGDRLAIGALGRQGEGASLTLNGAAYVYEWTTPDGWLESTRVDGETRYGTPFGSSVAIEGDSLAVGVDDGNGHVYTFARNAGGINGWGETDRIDGVVGSKFGVSVQIDSGVLVVPSSVSDRAVHLYARQADGTWDQTALVEGDNNEGSYNFATVVAKSGTTVIAAEPDPRDVQNPNQPLLPGAVHVFDINHAPEVEDLEIAVSEDVETEFYFSVTDPDDSDILRIEFTDPAHGEIRGDYPTLRYRPDRDFFGKDAIIATVVDEGGITREARISFEILPVNDAPQMPERFEKSELAGVGLVLRADDPEGDRLTFEIVDPPSHGTLIGEIPTLFYKPVQGYTGLDTFTYRAFDGELWSEVAEFDIFVPEDTEILVNPPDDNRVQEDDYTPPTLDGCASVGHNSAPVNLFLMSIVLLGSRRWRRRKRNGQPSRSHAK